VDVEVVQAPSREAGLMRTAAEWVVFLDDEDTPDDGFIDALVTAQAASGADVVTAAVRPRDGGVQLFLGDPGSLGLIANLYGVVGLVRSELAAATTLPGGGEDPDWLMFARLALAGARIVSIPEPLAASARNPGRIGDVPGEGLAVLKAFEGAGARELADLPQLTATLAAASTRSAAPSHNSVAPPKNMGVLGRIARRAKALLG
jgi:hypothetical protein